MKCVIGEQTRKVYADVGPPETNIINRSIIIGGYIIKIEILFT